MLFKFTYNYQDYYVIADNLVVAAEDWKSYALKHLGNVYDPDRVELVSRRQVIIR